MIVAQSDQIADRFGIPATRQGLSTDVIVALAALLWIALSAMSIATRPLLPIDETRYLSVAWEMWLRQDWLVPYLNGAPYSHKPPLLFWLMLAGWKLFGVSEIWARAVGPLVGIAVLPLMARLARLLWPGRTGEDAGGLAALMLAGTLCWALLATAAMFETLVTAFALVAAIGILEARHGRARLGWTLCALGLGCGALAKGPVIAVYVVPVAIGAWFFMPLPRPSPRGWIGGLAIALLAGAAIALAWAVPAALAGGGAYAKAILWSQTGDRMVESFAHRRPVWWYLPLLPLVTLPWTIWPVLWRGFTAKARATWTAERLLLCWMALGVLVFSLISGKQIHYLLPLLPAFCLFLAATVRRVAPRPLDHRVLVAALALLGAVLGPASEIIEIHLVRLRIAGLPPWGTEVGEIVAYALLTSAALVGLFPAIGNRGRTALLAACSLIVFAFAHGLGAFAARGSYDLQPIATHLHQAAERGSAIAYAGQYAGQFNFLGRLRAPVDQIVPVDIDPWLTAHPNGRVVLDMDDATRAAFTRTPEFEQRERTRHLVVIGGGS